MELVLGIDLGTSYFKLGLFDRAGGLRGLGRVAVQTETGDGPRCELPVTRFWSALHDGLGEALAQAGSEPADIQALAYSSQANSFLLLDEHDQPLTPLILWPDHRAEETDAGLEELWQRDDFLDVTGQGVQRNPKFAAAKLQWFRTRQPDVWSRARRIMTISDYLVFSLTGRATGDEGTTSLLGIWELGNRKWWDKALRTLHVSPSQLSTPLRPGTPAGPLTAEGAKRLGLNSGIPLSVGGLDHHVAAIGAGLGQVAQFSESTGTVLACLHCTDRYQPRKNCCMGPGVGEAEYYQLAFDGNGASALEWYQRRHAPQFSIPELVSLAEAVPIGSDGLVALPMANQYPKLDGFANKSPAHRPGHFARAIMESTAATLAELTGNLCPHERPKRIVATGGGARSALWLQIKADLLNLEFVAPACQEPACMGAAMFAATACNWFANASDAGRLWTTVWQDLQPNPGRHKSYTDWHKHYRRSIS